MAAAILTVLLTGCELPGNAEKAEVEKLKTDIASLRQELATKTKAEREGPSRWRIEMRAGVRADTYLIDTATGRVWREYEDPQTRLMFWSEMQKQDLPQLPNPPTR